MRRIILSSLRKLLNHCSVTERNRLQCRQQENSRSIFFRQVEENIVQFAPTARSQRFQVTGAVIIMKKESLGSNAVLVRSTLILSFDGSKTVCAERV